MIVWDDEEKRMVDDENGDYLKLRLHDREDHEYFAALLGGKRTLASLASMP